MSGAAEGMKLFQHSYIYDYGHEWHTAILANNSNDYNLIYTTVNWSEYGGFMPELSFSFIGPHSLFSVRLNVFKLYFRLDLFSYYSIYRPEYF